MAFAYSSNTDARHSSFNQAGRDWHQTHINNNTTIYNSPIHISYSLFGPRPIAHHIPNNLSDPPRLISSPETLSLGCVTHHSSNPATNFTTAVDLIDRIIDISKDNRYSWDGLPDLAPEFGSLRQTLILTRVTIQITPQALQCCIVLQELLDSVHGTWKGLNSTRISDWWRQVWRSRWDGDEFSLSKEKLSESRQLLQGVLMAVHSVAWMDLGDELREGYGSLRKFHELFSHRLPSLDRINFHVVDLVNHLGDVIPVPTIFCSTWKDFDYMVQGYCRNSIGHHLIEQGDYEVITTENNQTVGPGELASTVESGTKLEMSIVLRRGTVFQDMKEICPRCSYVNLNATADHGWIQCGKCSGRFNIAETDLKDRNERSDVPGVKECSEQLDAKASGDDYTEYRDEEVISPASRTIESATFEAPATVQRRDGGDGDGGAHSEDGTQFFRRIHVICMRDGGGNSSYDDGGTQLFPNICIDVIDPLVTSENEPPVSPSTSHMVKFRQSKSAEISQQDRIIAIMGPTGAGKSTFIETATGQGGQTIGHGLRSFTDTIRTVRVTHPVDGKPVVLVDIPGFGDTTKSETEILAMIAEWLVKVYKGKFNLATIVYLHRISDNRMPGSVLTNLQVFAGMCGQNAMPYVILATTMWDLVEERVGNTREQQLKRDFWQDMIADGCRTERFDGTHDSAWHILDCLAQKNRAPVLLSTEMVDTHLRLNETNAGITLNRELQKLIAEQKEAARKLWEHVGDQANEKIVRGLNQRRVEIEKKIRQTGDQIQQLKIPSSRRFVLFFKGRG